MGGNGRDKGSARVNPALCWRTGALRAGWKLGEEGGSWL